jgi:hypothetical protein
VTDEHDSRVGAVHRVGDLLRVGPVGGVLSAPASKLRIETSQPAA